MVRLPVEGFCIDSTEVTRGAYRTWLEKQPQIPDTGACQSNETYEPDCTWGAGTEGYPAACVDWCDADAYCRDAGKRLCGRIGGGTTDYATGYADAEHSEWFAACSSHGMYDFPYGDSWIADQCVDSGGSMVVASALTCQAPAPYDCVFDMSGNVREWENSCSDDADTALCRLRGGFYGDSAVAALACSADSSLQRTGAEISRGVGFRCCSDDCP
jgi:formylglycine-generating enzyme required for sulfatase activity